MRDAAARRSCPLDDHPNRIDIEVSIRRGVDPYTVIGAMFGVTAFNVGRHARVCMGVLVGSGSRVRCTFCGHPDRAEIDQLFRDGTPYQDIATRVGVAMNTAWRHGRKCLGLDRVHRHAGLWRNRGICCGVGALPNIDAVNAALLRGERPAAVAKLTPYGHSQISRHRRKCLDLDVGVGSFGQCTVCGHPEFRRIEDLMRSGVLTRVEMLRLFDLPGSSFDGHLRRHLDNPEWEAKLAAMAVSRLESVERYVEASEP